MTSSRVALRLLLTVGVVCALTFPAWAAEIVPQRYWDDAKAALRRGAYREALQSFELILTLAPNDPVAELYRSLCKQRLETPSPFTQLSTAQLASLQQSLRQEVHAQRRQAAQQKAIERQVKQEQARWDRDVAALQRSAEQERAKALARAQAEAPLVPQPPAPTPPVAEPSTPAEPSLPAPIPPPSAAPPTQPTSPTTQTGGIQTPELIHRPPPPPGAVQINARQMNMSPERNLAIAEGDVEIISGDTVLTADRVTLFTDTNDAYAEGQVRLAEGNSIFHGNMVHYNLNTHKGRFLQGGIASPPWHEHGRTAEHLAEGVVLVQQGALTSCDHDPPHFAFEGRRSVVFSEDKLVRSRHTIFSVEDFPLIYLPWMVAADRQSPFFIIPGKKRPWGQFALMGYRYEFSANGNHEGALKLDWRRFFGWGVGVDHKMDSERWGKALLRVYYNNEPNHNREEREWLKGAERDRYRILWRHAWRPRPDTNILTNIQEFGDAEYRKEFLFREEFVEDDVGESFISAIKSVRGYSLSALVRKRMNRFETVNEVSPQLTFDVASQPIGDSLLFSETKFDAANFQTKRAHSDDDTDVVRLDWFQQLKYGLNLFRPVLVTPRAGVRQTYYTKDIQGGAERPQGKRDVISGQFSMGLDASLKLFRIFPVTTNAWGLNVNWLRHVLTPTVTYAYTHRPTVPSSLLTFAAADGGTNQITWGLENKLQTKRSVGGKKPRSFDVVRWTTSLPYTFHGSANEQGGRWGDWSVDVELYPWPWMRLETDFVVPSHFIRGTRDDRIQQWNTDLVIVGGRSDADASKAAKIHAQDVQAPERKPFEVGPRGTLTELLMPVGQWYLGFGHRYQQNSKTESVIQFDWRPSEKWEIGTFHRFTWKEVAGDSKRFGNVREYQYALRRDLHDWIAELVYRVDREFGEELFLVFTLKAYPNMPIEFETTYHQPKFGSQSSPFSPVQR